MSTPGPKQAIFESLAEVAQALGHSNRLELLEYLAQGQRSVEELAALSGMSFANTSRHLQILRRARLVETERRGKHVIYSLAGDAEVVTLISALSRVGERNLAEVNRVLSDYFHARDSMEAVTREDLAERLEAGLVTVLDVRPEEEFVQGHLPGALPHCAPEASRPCGWKTVFRNGRQRGWLSRRRHGAEPSASAFCATSRPSVQQLSGEVEHSGS